MKPCRKGGKKSRFWGSMSANGEGEKHQGARGPKEGRRRPLRERKENTSKVYLKIAEKGGARGKSESVGRFAGCRTYKKPSLLEKKKRRKKGKEKKGRGRLKFAQQLF